MDQNLKNRRLLIGGAIVALLAYGGYRQFEHRHEDAISVAIDDDKDDKSSPSDNASTPVEINADNKTGTMGIKTPVFSGNITIPGLDLGKGGNINFDGIKLYPGAKLGQMKVNNDSDNSGHVAVDFDAPAAQNLVHDYYVKSLTENGFTVDAGASTASKIIAEKDDGDKHFEVELSPTGAATTHGKLTINGD